MLKKISGSLTSKIIILLNVFLIVPAIILLIFFNTKVTQSIAAEIEKTLVAVTREKLDKLDQRLTGMEELTQSIAEQPYMKEFFDGLNQGRPADPVKRKRIAAYLEKELQNGNGIYENLLFYYKQVTIIDGIGGKSLGKETTQKDRLMGLIRLSPTTGRPVMVDYLPVYGDGMFVMAIELNNITGKIIDSGQDNLMKSVIIDADGMVVASENREQIMKFNFKEAGADTARFLETVKTKTTGTDFVTLDGQRCIAAFAKDPNRPLYLVSYTPISQYTQTSRELAVWILVLLLICIASGLLVSGFLTRRLIKQPISNLIAATERMALGDCDARVDVKSKDEIGKLSQSFNAMAGNIREGALAAARIAAGDLDVTLPVRSEKDLLNHNLNGMIKNIQLLVTDINTLAESAIQGQLSVRADESGLNGDFRKIVAGINRTLEAIVQPFDDGVGVLQKMSVNDLTSQMEPAKYQGMLRQFAEQINSVRSSLEKVQNDFVQISQGNISNLDQLINTGKLSENDQLTPAAIATMTNLRKLIAETERISTSAAAGDLKIRGNADQFEGGYRQIISGMNRTLEAIVAPINETAAVLQEMAGGNLGVEVSGAYQGDYAVLAETVNHTILSFNETLSEIQEAARQVAAGADQIAASSQSLSQSATEQASTVEEINASLNEITHQTKQNALNAGQVNELSQSAQATAVSGNALMNDMLTAMEEINNSSATISKIIKVIDEIAFQTNILSLNAAVEAARAGAHGKGFAVVAEEVRNLAARSANAARETTHMIEASIKKVESGTAIARETAAELNQIVESIGRTAALVGEIATASKEQATGIVQISQGVDQVSQVTQTSTATAQESAASSEELAAQAEFLKGKIAQFKLKNDTIELNSPAQVQKPALTGKTAAVKRKIQLREDDFGKY
jgi:methyl-accepting chemotaxis protein